MKITRRQLRRIIRESVKRQHRSRVDEGFFDDLSNFVAKKFGKIGNVGTPQEEKENLGQSVSRYITSVIKASREDKSMKDKSEDDIKGGGVEAARKAVDEIIKAWESGGN